MCLDFKSTESQENDKKTTVINYKTSKSYIRQRAVYTDDNLVTHSALFLQGTSTLSLYIDVALTLSIFLDLIW